MHNRMHEVLLTRFEAELDLLYQIEKQAGRTHRRFKRMLNEHGALETARRLIGKRNTQGLQELKDAGLLEMSIEAIVLKPEYDELFADDVFVCMRQRAQAKLDALRQGRDLPDEEAPAALKKLRAYARSKGTTLDKLHRQAQANGISTADFLEQLIAESSQREAANL